MAEGSSDYGSDFEKYIGVMKALDTKKLLNNSTRVNPTDSTLVVIDMQNDFSCVDNDSECAKGALGVGNLEHAQKVRDNCVELMQMQGWKHVALTKDLHPEDHVSFGDEKRKGFPKHCTHESGNQSDGARFVQSIKDAANNIDPKPTVYFKGFNKHTESFGAVKYERKNTPANRLMQNNLEIVGTDIVSMQPPCMTHYTGAYAFKLTDTEDVDSNPVYAQFEEHETRKLCKAVKGVERLDDMVKEGDVYICGLALNFCVLDTALNIAFMRKKLKKDAKNKGGTAKKLGTVYIVIDATRPVIMKGLDDPSEMMQLINKAGVKFARVSDSFNDIDVVDPAVLKQVDGTFDSPYLLKKPEDGTLLEDREFVEKVKFSPEFLKITDPVGADLASVIDDMIVEFQVITASIPQTLLLQQVAFAVAEQKLHEIIEEFEALNKNTDTTTIKDNVIQLYDKARTARQENFDELMFHKPRVFEQMPVDNQSLIEKSALDKLVQSSISKYETIQKLIEQDKDKYLKQFFSKVILDTIKYLKSTDIHADPISVLADLDYLYTIGQLFQGEDITAYVSTISSSNNGFVNTEGLTAARYEYFFRSTGLKYEREKIIFSEIEITYAKKPVENTELTFLDQQIFDLYKKLVNDDVYLYSNIKRETCEGTVSAFVGNVYKKVKSQFTNGEKQLARDCYVFNVMRITPGRGQITSSYKTVRMRVTETRNYIYLKMALEEKERREERQRRQYDQVDKTANDLADQIVQHIQTKNIVQNVIDLKGSSVKQGTTFETTIPYNRFTTYKFDDYTSAENEPLTTYTKNLALGLEKKHRVKVSKVSINAGDTITVTLRPSAKVNTEDRLGNEGAEEAPANNLFNVVNFNKRANNTLESDGTEASTSHFDINDNLRTIIDSLTPVTVTVYKYGKDNEVFSFNAYSQPYEDLMQILGNEETGYINTDTKTVDVFFQKDITHIVETIKSALDKLELELDEKQQLTFSIGDESVSVSSSELDGIATIILRSHPKYFVNTISQTEDSQFKIELTEELEELLPAPNFPTNEEQPGAPSEEVTFKDLDSIPEYEGTKEFIIRIGEYGVLPGIQNLKHGDVKQYFSQHFPNHGIAKIEENGTDYVIEIKRKPAAEAQGGGKGGVLASAGFLAGLTLAVSALMGFDN